MKSSFALRLPAALFSISGIALFVCQNGFCADDPFAEMVRSTEPLTGEEQQAKFKLPPGFEIQLVAAEPDINKPMNMAFDAQGRLWVSTSIEYPFAAPTNRPGRDRVMIFEDFDSTGRARQVTEFANGLNVPIGLCPLPRGSAKARGAACIVWSIPNIWLMEDTDGDGKADRREVLYGPFDYTRDTHGNQASFRRGFDGWVYATHGFNNDSHVKGADGHEVHLNSGNTYRFRTDGSRIEHHTWGQVNPFGLAWDPRGNLYSSDCHSSPVYQLLAGAYYPSFGKPHDGLGFAPTLMQHSHGSTAIDGMLYYADDLWPDEFEENVFVGNVMTSRVNRDRLVFNGSSPKAVELDDFVKCDDPWFRPVDNQLGPDGAFYIADFYNRIIGHYEVPLTHPGRDRERGRIWRVIYTGEDVPSKPRDLKLRATLDDLTEELASASLSRRLLAMNEIADRFGASAESAVTEAFEKPANPFQRAHAMWILDRLDAFTDPLLLSAARDAAALVRAHAMRVIAERGRLSHRLGVDDVRRTGYSPVLDRAAVVGLEDSDALVQRCAAEALGTVPLFNHVAPLLALRHRVPTADTHLLYVVRKSLRNQLRAEHVFSRVLDVDWSAKDARALADVAVAVTNAQAALFLLNHVAETAQAAEPIEQYLRQVARYLPPEQMDRLAVIARNRFAGDLDLQLALFKSVREGVAQRGARMTEPLCHWGTSLAARLLEPDEDAQGWSAVPLDGASDSPTPWTVQERKSADGDRADPFFSSLPKGETLTGVLRSRPFSAPETLSFFLAGHDGYPDKPIQDKNRVRLRSVADHSILREVSPPRHDTAQRVDWDLGDHAGRQVYLEVIDGDSAGAYAWLAIGRFDPPVVQVPPAGPATRAARERVAAEIAAICRARYLGPALLNLLTNHFASIEGRVAAAEAVTEVIHPVPMGELERILKDVTEPAAVREAVAKALAGVDHSSARDLVIEALQAAPERMQVKLAQMLAGTAKSGEALLKVIAAGKASPRLLQDKAVKERLQASKIPGLEERLAELTRALPPLDEQRQKLMEERRNGYLRASAPDLARGAQVFAVNCAACHQIRNEGGLIGPQLDGVGNRGLDRLIEDTLDPNRNVDHAFRYSTVTLADDQVITALLRREEGELLVFADTTGREIPVQKSQVEERIQSDYSLMPDNFGELISPEDFNHLLAYLLAQKPESGPEQR